MGALPSHAFFGAFGRAAITGREADVQMRFHPAYSADAQDRVLERAYVAVFGDLAMEDRDMVLDHDVNVRYVEALLNAADTGADAIDENVVAHVGVRMPPGEPVDEPGHAARGIPRVARDFS